MASLLTMSIRPSRPVAPAVWAIVLLAAGAYAQQAEQFDEYAAVSPSVPEGRSGPSARVGNIELELNLTSLRHHAGEAAVGASAGVLGAWVAHRLQSTALLLSVLGGLGTAAALHLKWVSSDQVHAAPRCALLFYFSAAGCALALALIRLIQTPTRRVRPLACAGAPARLWHLPVAAAEVGLAHATGGPRWRRQCVNGIFQPTLARARDCVADARAVRARIQPDPGGPVLTLLRLCSRLILPAVNLDDSRIAYSKIAPFVKQHTALTGGAVAGFVVAYSGLR